MLDRGMSSLRLFLVSICECMCVCVYLCVCVYVCVCAYVWNKVEKKIKYLKLVCRWVPRGGGVGVSTRPVTLCVTIEPKHHRTNSRCILFLAYGLVSGITRRKNVCFRKEMGNFLNDAFHGDVLLLLGKRCYFIRFSDCFRVSNSTLSVWYDNWNKFIFQEWFLLCMWMWIRSKSMGTRAVETIMNWYEKLFRSWKF